MGGEGSGRKPNFETVIERMRPETVQPIGDGLIIPNYSGIKDSAKKGTPDGAVNGSGTENYITKWASSGSLTNSIIYEDETNVGVNNTNPYYDVDVQSSVGNSMGVLTLGSFSGVNFENASITLQNSNSTILGNGTVNIESDNSPEDRSRIIMGAASMQLLATNAIVLATTNGDISLGTDNEADINLTSSGDIVMTTTSGGHFISLSAEEININGNGSYIHMTDAISVNAPEGMTVVTGDEQIFAVTSSGGVTLQSGGYDILLDHDGDSHLKIQAGDLYLHCDGGSDIHMSSGMTIHSEADMYISSDAGVHINSNDDNNITVEASGDLVLNTGADLIINTQTGFSGTVTTASLVGKTMTFTNGILTGFA